MKERPIIFNSEMVRAILEGRKTQTRRPIKPQPLSVWCKEPITVTDGKWTSQGCVSDLKCPHGQIGDRLWVRETWSELNITESSDKSREGNKELIYKATNTEFPDSLPWRPSIHMPRWASRILLEITDARAERVQDISEEDAEAEGIYSKCKENHYSPLGCEDCLNTGVIKDGPPIEYFQSLWNSIYKDNHSWAKNPWVGVTEFKKLGGI